MTLTIEQLQKQVEQQHAAFGEERQRYISELMTLNRKIGELETKLLQLAAPVPVKNSINSFESRMADEESEFNVRALGNEGSVRDKSITQLKIRRL